MKTLLVSALMALAPFGGAAAGEKLACNAKALSATERVRYQELTAALMTARRKP